MLVGLHHTRGTRATQQLEGGHEEALHEKKALAQQKRPGECPSATAPRSEPQNQMATFDIFARSVYETLTCESCE